MPKPSLKKEDEILERAMIETFIAGLHEWRSDLNYPESYSDMQAGIRGLLKMFDVKRRPLVTPLKINCYHCSGLGDFIRIDEHGTRHITECRYCDGKGWTEGT